VGNHKLIISIENVKKKEPRRNYLISLLPLTGYSKIMNTGNEEKIKKKKKNTFTLHGGFEAER
jgi:hypothetical protein